MLKACGWCGRYLDGELHSLEITTGLCPVCSRRVRAEVGLPRAALRPSASEDMERGEMYSETQSATRKTSSRLDYLGCEVQPDGMATSFRLASAHVDLIDSTWLALRPQVVSAGGEVEASDMDGTISDQRAAIDASDGAALADAATAQLEVVDAIEGVFAEAGADPSD